jgi:hypothetical protein
MGRSDHKEDRIKTIPLLVAFTTQYSIQLKKSACILDTAQVGFLLFKDNKVNRLGTKNKFGDEKLDMEV